MKKDVPYQSHYPQNHGIDWANEAEEQREQTRLLRTCEESCLHIRLRRNNENRSSQGFQGLQTHIAQVMRGHRLHKGLDRFSSAQHNQLTKHAL